MRPRKASVAKDPRNPTRPWVVRWSESTEDGRRHRKSKAFPKQREAEKYANRKTRELRGEVAPIDEPMPERVGGLGDTPLGVFVNTYLERRRSESLRPATLKLYRDNLNRLVNHFGEGRGIGTITPDGIAKFIAEQRIVLKCREGQTLSKSSRNSIVRDLKIAFRLAASWGYVSVSPMAGVKLLKVNTDDRRGWHYLSPSEFWALLKNTDSDSDKAAYAIMYGAGLRYGEAYSLQPSDVDLSGGYVHVRPREATPDTPPFRIKDHECRSIPLPKYAVDLIAKWLESRPDGSPYLFVSPERYERIKPRWRRMQARGEQWQNKWLANNTVRNLRLRAERAEITLTAPLTIHSLRKSYGRSVLPVSVHEAI